MTSSNPAAPLDIELPPEDFPSIDQVFLVTSFTEATEILRSPSFRPGYGTRSVRVVIDSDGNVHRAGSTDYPEDDPAAGQSWDDVFRHGDLSRSHGPDHLRLRRTLNPLFGRDAHLWFRDTVILPTLTRNLDNVLSHPDSSGTPRCDMVAFARRVFVQAAAALVGFDRTDTAEGADLLLDLHGQIQEGLRFANVLPDGPELDRVLRRAIVGRRELFERFYAPSFERRRELLRRRRDGKAPEGDVPHDLLTLLADGSSDSPHEADAGVAMATQLLRGSTGTNTVSLTNALANLADWFVEHPEDHELRTDAAFLEGAVRETIRLQSPGAQVFSRIALDDVKLSSGRAIRSGQYVALLKDVINQDPAVFGPSAARFDPRRRVPSGVHNFGLGFGAGAHMCMGVPLVLGQGGVTGMQVPVLQALHAAGVGLDDTMPPNLRTELLPHRREYVTFPVVFHNHD